MEIIAWVVLKKIDSAMTIDNIYDLVEHMDDNIKSIPFTNMESGLLDGEVYAAGFIDNEYYEEIEAVMLMLSEICNELGYIKENEKEYSVKLSDGTIYNIVILDDIN